jgi:uncharacterized protein involved in cysteine biosynthesis
MGVLLDWPSHFAQGVGLPFRALWLLKQHRSTWRRVGALSLLSGVGLVFGLTVGWGMSAAFLTALWTPPTAGWALPTLWHLIHAAIYGLGLAFNGLTLIIGAPLNDWLSAEVERIALGEHTRESGLRRLLREALASVAAAAMRLVRFGIIQAALLLLTLIPGGEGLYAVAAFVWGALWLSQQYLDMTMARHLHTPAETRAALRQVRPLALGLGLVLGALFVLPVVNLLFLPIGVTSGALLYCDLVAQGLVERTGEGPRLVTSARRGGRRNPRIEAPQVGR